MQAKKEADKLAKQMEELDDEFGVGELVSEKLKKDREEQYTARNLRGMRVEHSSEHFRSGNSFTPTFTSVVTLCSYS